MKLKVAFLAVLGAGLLVTTIDSPAAAKATSGEPYARNTEAAPDAATAAGKAKHKPKRKAAKAHAATKKSRAQASRKRGRSTTMLSTTIGSVGTPGRGRQSVPGRLKVALPARPALIAKPVPAPNLDDARHRQIAVAESAARSPVRSDRWESVLFLLNDVDPRAYPAACFWRVLAQYRLGRLTRADADRPNCRLSATDSQALDAEKKASANLQGAPGQVAASATAAIAPGADEFPPIRNNLPYEGPAPTQVATAP